MSSAFSACELASLLKKTYNYKDKMLLVFLLLLLAPLLLLVVVFLNLLPLILLDESVIHNFLSKSL